MRCYNGCPDSKLKAKLDKEDKLTIKLKKIYPEAHCTYFPVEGYFQVWINFIPVGGWENEKKFSSRISALEWAIYYLNIEISKDRPAPIKANNDLRETS